MTKTDVLTYGQLAIAFVVVLIWAYNTFAGAEPVTLDELLHLLIGLGLAAGPTRAKLNGG